MRLSLEKKLAASSQKFADAARLSAELKALAAKVEADRAAPAIMGQQIEGARAALGSAAEREAELQRELEGEQRDLDQAKWRLLVEHEEAIASVLAEADAADGELLRVELGNSQAARAQLRVKWGWDESGRPQATEADLLGIGVAADEEEGESEEESESDSEGRAGARRPRASPSSRRRPRPRRRRRRLRA